MSTRTDPHGKKDVKHICISGGEVLDDDHNGIRCDNGQCHLCGDCSKVFARTVCSELDIRVDRVESKVKCFCGSRINPVHVERFLEPNELVVFMTYFAMIQLSGDEVGMECPFCDYFEIWERLYGGVKMFICKKEGCKQAHCNICKHRVPQLEGFDSEAGAFESMEAQDAYERHLMTCGEFAIELEEIRNCLDEGVKNRCPKCKVAGMKDNGCTHMTCNGCQCRWCYLCGLSEEQLGENVGQHNTNWRSHASKSPNGSRRCPMFLAELDEVDHLFEDAEAQESPEAYRLEKYHRLKTLRLLRAAIRSMGIERFQHLKATYNEVSSIPYSEEEIFGSDLRLAGEPRLIGGVPHEA